MQCVFCALENQQGHRHPAQYCLRWTGRVLHASASASQNSKRSLLPDIGYQTDAFSPNVPPQEAFFKTVTFNENSLKGSEDESLLWADPHKTLPFVSQVNMLIGIVVFNKLMSRDGISDKSKKQRAG